MTLIGVEINQKLDDILALIRDFTERDRHDIEGQAMDIINDIRTMVNEQDIMVNTRYDLATKQIQSISYAAAVKSTPATSKSTAVLVYPTTEIGASNDTLTYVKKKLNPSDHSISIQHVKLIKNGGLAIVVDDKEQANKICDELNKTERLKCSVKHKRNPYIKIKAVPQSTSDEQIVNAIKNMHSCSRLNEADPKVVYKTRISKDRSHVVVQLCTLLWQEMVKTGYLSMDWERYKVVNEVPIKRCYKCQQFGHVSGNCSGALTCSFCAGNHSVYECKSISTTGRCSNCMKNRSKIDDNHPAYSVECPLYQKISTRLVSEIQYE